MLEPNH